MSREPVERSNENREQGGNTSPSGFQYPSGVLTALAVAIPIINLRREKTGIWRSLNQPILMLISGSPESLSPLKAPYVALY